MRDNTHNMVNMMLNKPTGLCFCQTVLLYYELLFLLKKKTERQTHMQFWQHMNVGNTHEAIVGVWAV